MKRHRANDMRPQYTKRLEKEFDRLCDCKGWLRTMWDSDDHQLPLNDYQKEAAAYAWGKGEYDLSMQAAELMNAYKEVCRKISNNEIDLTDARLCGSIAAQLGEIMRSSAVMAHILSAQMEYACDFALDKYKKKK